MRLKKLALALVMALMMLLSVALVDGGQSAFAQIGPVPDSGTSPGGGAGGTLP
jgi:hypothetical protein